MKTVLTIIIIVLIIVGIIIGIRIHNQNKKIDSIEKAEIKEPEENKEMVMESDSKTTITKTSLGITQTGDVMIDEENTFLKFTGFGPGKEHPGSFDSMTTELEFTDGQISGGGLVIEASSINTGIDGLDSHLQTGDFLNVENNPQITFKLNDVVVNDEDQSAIAEGTLTMNGVAKDITVPVTLLANGFSVDFLLDMSIFGISYTGVNDQVQVEAQVIWK